MRKEIITLAAAMFALAMLANISSADSCAEYKVGNQLMLELFNVTTYTPLTNQNCNITFLNYPSFSVALGNVSTSSQGTGFYNWTINTSLTAGNKYIAVAYCGTNTLDNFMFCVVSNYSSEITQSANTTINQNLLSANSTINANILSTNSTINSNIISTNTSINTNILNVGRNLTDMNITLINQIQNINNTLLTNINTTLVNQLTASFSQINQTFITSMNNSMFNSFSLINETFITAMNNSMLHSFSLINETFITAMNQTLADQLTALSDYMATTFWDEMVYLTGVTNTKITAAQNNFTTQLNNQNTTNKNFYDDVTTQITNIPANVWAYGTRTVTSIGSFGSLIADIWAYGSKPVLDVNIANGTQQEQLYNASQNLGGGGITNNYINNATTNTNTTFNVILPIGT